MLIEVKFNLLKWKIKDVFWNETELMVHNIQTIFLERHFSNRTWIHTWQYQFWFHQQRNTNSNPHSCHFSCLHNSSNCNHRFHSKIYGSICSWIAKIRKLFYNIPFLIKRKPDKFWYEVLIWSFVRFESTVPHNWVWNSKYKIGISRISNIFLYEIWMPLGFRIYSQVNLELKLHQINP